MKSLDVSGLSCPIPVIRVKQLMDAGEKEILVCGDTKVSQENVSKLASSQGYSIRVMKSKPGEWQLELKS